MRVQLNQETVLEEEEKRYDEALETVGIRTLGRNIKGKTRRTSAFFKSRDLVLGLYELKEGPYYYMEEDTYRFDILHICDSCGIEFYGRWNKITSICSMFEVEGIGIYGYDNEHPEVKELHKKGLETYTQQFWEKQLPSIRKIKDIDHCICCGGKLSKKPWHYFIYKVPQALQEILPGLSETKPEYKYRVVENDCLSTGSVEGCIASLDRMDHAYTGMRRALEYKDKEEAYEKAERLRLSYDLPVTAALKPGAVAAIKGDSEQLKEYILNLLKLEMNIFFLEKRLPQLYYQKKKYDRAANFAMYSPRIVLKQDVLDAERKYNDCLNKQQQYQAGNLPTAQPVAPAEPAYNTPGLFNKKKVLQENEHLKEIYQTALAAYEEALRQYEAENKRLLAEAEESVKMAKEGWEALKTKAENFTPDKTGSLPEVQFKTMMDQELENAEGLLRSMYQSRNELYSFNIIFSKYHNPVALSAFYEYLMAGRCTSLEGADGAYNIYEQEIRADRIIDQLGEVITQLEEIKSNQYMIYQELRTVNQNLDRLNQTTAAISESIQDIEKSVDTIAYNSAVTAHYTKMNAELTNALGYMVAFK